VLQQVLQGGEPEAGYRAAIPQYLRSFEELMIFKVVSGSEGAGVPDLRKP
jgi:hypothetical protein